MGALDPRQAVRAYLEAYASGSPEALLSHLAADHVYHGPAGAPPLDRDGRGAESTAFLAAFANVRVEIADQIAEGDRVATRVVMRAVHSGAYQGIPPSGRTVTMPFIDVATVRDGTIVEEWAEFDIATIVRQIAG